MLIKVNGEAREFEDGLLLPTLVSLLNLKPEQIAIELNKSVVRRSDWAMVHLSEGDQIEIVHFVGGGLTDYPQTTPIVVKPR